MTTWFTPIVFDVLVAVVLTIGWTAILFALPFAVAQGNFREWLREAMLCLYFSAWAIGGAAAYTYLIG